MSQDVNLSPIITVDVQRTVTRNNIQKVCENISLPVRVSDFPSQNSTYLETHKRHYEKNIVCNNNCTHTQSDRPHQGD